jgi:hypothetical protein
MPYRSGSSFVLVLLAFAALGLGGCLGVGGCGGDPATTGLIKVGTGQMTQLSTDEVKALVQTFAAQQGVTMPEITDEEAAAAIAFLQANSINTIDQLMALLQNPSGVTVPPEVLQVLQNLGAHGSPST